MRYKQDRCIHCGTTYITGSCWGEFCPPCSNAIAAALVKIPKKFEKVWEKTKAWSVEQCLEQKRVTDAEGEAKAKKEGRPYLPIRRVAMPLFDLEDGTNINKTGYVKMLDGVQYLYSYWTRVGPGRGSVRVAMEKNLDTGELLPWK